MTDLKNFLCNMKVLSAKEEINDELKKINDELKNTCKYCNENITFDDSVSINNELCEKWECVCGRTKIVTNHKNWLKKETFSPTVGYIRINKKNIQI